MKLAIGFAVAPLLVLVTLGVGVGFGPRFLQQTPQQQQRRTELVIKLNKDAAPAIAARELFATVRTALREPRIGFASIAPSSDAVDVTLIEGVDRAHALSTLHALSRQPGSPDAAASERFTIAETDGAMVRLTPTPAALAEEKAHAVDQTIQVLTQRLDSLQLKPAFRREEGDDTVVIDVPHQADTARLKPLLVAPGKLSFRLVDTSISVEEARRGRMPSQSEILLSQDGTPYLAEKRVAMSGENLIQAQPGFDQRTNEPIVSFRFNAVGTRQFARLTEQSVGSPMAVVLDGVVLAVPIIREPIVGGSGQISGGFTLERANDLAVMMQSGELPVPLAIVDERTVGPD
jgi:preprotein translocase subunit SecD